MTARAILAGGGGFVLGLILTVVGWVMTPDPASFVFPGPINVAGQSLIALGLTFVIISVALLLAAFQERAMAMMGRP